MHPAHKIVFTSESSAVQPLLLARRGKRFTVPGRHASRIEHLRGPKGDTLDIETYLASPKRLTGYQADGVNWPHTIAHTVVLGNRWQTLWSDAPERRVQIDLGVHDDGYVPPSLSIGGPEGLIRNQAFWQGTPFRLVGLAESATSRGLAMSAERFWREPAQAVGLRPVVADWTAGMRILGSTVEKVQVSPGRAFSGSRN